MGLCCIHINTFKSNITKPLDLDSVHDKAHWVFLFEYKRKGGACGRKCFVELTLGIVNTFWEGIKSQEKNEFINGN